MTAPTNNTAAANVRRGRHRMPPPAKSLRPVKPPRPAKIARVKRERGDMSPAGVLFRQFGWLGLCLVVIAACLGSYLFIARNYIDGRSPAGLLLMVLSGVVAILAVALLWRRRIQARV